MNLEQFIEVVSSYPIDPPNTYPPKIDPVMCSFCGTKITGVVVFGAQWSGKDRQSFYAPYHVNCWNDHSAQVIYAVGYVFADPPSPTLRDRWYAKQYWKLRHQAFLLDAEIEYDCATCDSSLLDDEIDPRESELRKMIRLAQFAKEKMDNPEVTSLLKPPRLFDRVTFDMLWEDYKS